jgi:hypothetical protein
MVGDHLERLKKWNRPLTCLAQVGSLCHAVTERMGSCRHQCVAEIKAIGWIELVV